MIRAILVFAHFLLLRCKILAVDNFYLYILRHVISLVVYANRLTVCQSTVDHGGKAAASDGTYESVWMDS